MSRSKEKDSVALEEVFQGGFDDGEVTDAPKARSTRPEMTVEERRVIQRQTQEAARVMLNPDALISRLGHRVDPQGGRRRQPTGTVDIATIFGLRKAITEAAMASSVFTSGIPPPPASRDEAQSLGVRADPIRFSGIMTLGFWVVEYCEKFGIRVEKQAGGASGRMHLVDVLFSEDSDPEPLLPLDALEFEDE